MKKPTPETLAAEFISILQVWLTREEREAIDALNKIEENDSICHSHDYCDPNQAMLDALARFGIVDYSAADEKLNALINSAWDIAKKKGFAS